MDISQKVKKKIEKTLKANKGNTRAAERELKKEKIYISAPSIRKYFPSLVSRSKKPNRSSFEEYTPRIKKALEDNDGNVAAATRELQAQGLEISLYSVKKYGQDLISPAGGNRDSNTSSSDTPNYIPTEGEQRIILDARHRTDSFAEMQRYLPKRRYNTPTILKWVLERHGKEPKKRGGTNPRQG